MRNKRFVCIDVGYGADWYITDNGKRLSEMEIVDLLNEQQSIIKAKDEEILKLKKDIIILQKRIELYKTVMTMTGYIDWEKEIERLEEVIGEQQATIEQLRTQLLICQQSKSDDGRIKVWQVPPIPKGMRITSFTTFNGENDE